MPARVVIESLARIVASLLLAIHGLVHLLGTAVYLGLTEFDEFPYKTTVLGGVWDLGEVGIRIFGLLWAVAAVGFVVSSVGMLIDRLWALPLLAATTMLSLVLTGLDWEVAYTGLVINFTIVAVLFWVRARAVVPTTSAPP